MQSRLFDVPGELFDGAVFERRREGSGMEPPERVSCAACGGMECECEARGFVALRLV